MAQEAEAMGYEVGLTAKSHLRCMHPNGALVVVSSELKLHNWRNALADLRRKKAACQQATLAVGGAGA
jgi:hypothetical protein